jgi:diguanylate cyclase (GGDEF)-like protein
MIESRTQSVDLFPANERLESESAWTPGRLLGQLVIGLVLLALLITHYVPAREWFAEAGLTVAWLIASIWVGLKPAQLALQARKLAALLPAVRHGRAPIESLSKFRGSIAPLARTCQELARELRQQRTGNNQLREEIRQKIASRTEALERTIGALRQQAARDPLTGLFNRRMLDAYLPEAISRCKMSTGQLCVLMIDIDHFKELNDALGHDAGDQMLRSLAQIIRSTVRETDLAFRLGGDEFVVVLEDCPSDPGQRVAARLASLADGLGRTFRLTPAPTLSVGLSSLSTVNDPTPAAMLKQADEVLYEVKEQHHKASGGGAPRRKSA